MARRVIDVRGASEHNLTDVDVSIGPGLTAVVGVSGSGKSSLAFDTVYHEAHRRFLETLSLGSAAAPTRPAAVRSVSGLGPAVAVAQNVLNHNPASTVATAVGAHPFLRILYSRFAQVRCPACQVPVRQLSEDERVREARRLAGDVRVPLVRGVAAGHQRLLDLLVGQFGPRAVEVDGHAVRNHKPKPLDPAQPHDIVVTTGHIGPDATVASVRAALAEADALGSPEVVVGTQSLLRAPICPGCGTWVPRLPATAFRPESGHDTSSHTIADHSLAGVLALTAEQAAAFVDDLADALGPTARRVLDELHRRLRPLVSLGLDHLALGRSMPTLSRGEAQRVRLAVILAGRLEDLLHVLDEPSIGLHRRDMKRLFDALATLPGPVVMVDHDAAAVAQADDVIEIGPGPGPAGGRLMFQGTPGKLWDAETASGRFFSGRDTAISRRARPAGADYLLVRGARVRYLDGFDCRFPLGRLTAVTGPSGAGKSTLVRDVVLASAEAGRPVGCDGFEGPVRRAVSVDQSPLGNNPRSNPATYTKASDRVRELFASATGGSPSQFSFNRPEGACPSCEGMGAVEVAIRYSASTWVTCEACDGQRYKPEVLELVASFRGRTLSIADALALSVDEARDVFAEDRFLGKTLDALADVGLGYLRLGQPSPTLSGGEAQRVRLARQLARVRSGDLVVLDEPTTGLHPADLCRLVSVLDGLVDGGCTVIVVEHQPDLVASVDWIVELGPGGGLHGGTLIHCGPPPCPSADGAVGGDIPAPRRRPRPQARASDTIQIRRAHAHNLRRVDVEIPKGRFTAVTGVSGSGKSSLVRDVIEAEAMRRLLEGLSMYERQGTREGPEAPVDSIRGLGPTLALGAAHRWSSGYAQMLNRPRATVGSASDLSRLVAVILARGGVRHCLRCGEVMRRLSPAPEAGWECTVCGTPGVPLEPRHLNTTTPTAACPRCAGLGIIRRGDVSRLIVHPDKPICGGAMYSPGYFPRGFLCTEGTGGNRRFRVLAAKYRFDPHRTPWKDLPPEAQEAYLHGDPEVLRSKRGKEFHWPGVMTELTRWDMGGLYTTEEACPRCQGKRLKPEYLSVAFAGRDRADLHSMPLDELAAVLDEAPPSTDVLVVDARRTASARLRFLTQVGLGYIHLDRLSATLSAGEAQRVKLASVLGSGLVGMTILLDEPTRGLHPREVAALVDAIEELRDAGNTVVAVEHDGLLLTKAEHVIELGPGPGEQGGEVTYQGPRSQLGPGVTREAIVGAPIRRAQSPGGDPGQGRRTPKKWMEIRGATEHNLDIESLRIPLGVLVGVCGVSGSGKSTLMIDTVGLALAPPKITTSVAVEQYRPGAHRAIIGSPSRTVVTDQSRSGITSAGHVLGLVAALRKAYADSDGALAAALTEKDFSSGCDACAHGEVVENMGFLPAVVHPCEVCDGTGYVAEVRQVVARGRTLPETEAGTIDRLAAEWGDIPAIHRACTALQRLGLGYLQVRQPGWSLSGGEAQRVKLAKELAKAAPRATLYLLDEPTAGLHIRDVTALAAALEAVVEAGNSVVIVDHDPNLLACCDWLVELGPVGGPRGGRVIATGPPEEVASGPTPTAPYLATALGQKAPAKTHK